MSSGSNHEPSGPPWSSVSMDHAHLPGLIDDAENSYVRRLWLPWWLLVPSWTFGLSKWGRPRGSQSPCTFLWSSTRTRSRFSMLLISSGSRSDCCTDHRWVVLASWDFPSLEYAVLMKLYIFSKCKCTSASDLKSVDHACNEDQWIWMRSHKQNLRPALLGKALEHSRFCGFASAILGYKQGFTWRAS